MDYQVLFNIVGGAFSVTLGVLLRFVWEKLNELQRCDATLMGQIHTVENQMGSQYMTRAELHGYIATMRVELQANRAETHSSTLAVFAKLDRIEDKLDDKQDKP